jgi:hypothetical protein
MSGLWIFVLSVFIFGYIQRLTMRAFKYNGKASNCLCGILSFWFMGELGFLSVPTMFATV